MQAYVLNSLKKPQTLDTVIYDKKKFTSQRSTSDIASFAFEEMVLSNEVHIKLQNLLHVYLYAKECLQLAVKEKGYVSRIFQFFMGSSMLSTSSSQLESHLLPFPNIILYGQAGVGKTKCATLLAEVSNIPYIVVCGGDLLAYGDMAAKQLTDIIENGIRLYANTGLVLVLDGVEGIIQQSSQVTNLGWDNDEGENIANMPSFGSASSTSGNYPLAGKECLHVLLHRMRQKNCRYLSIIVTTTLPLENIDTALLDR